MINFVKIIMIIINIVITRHTIMMVIIVVIMMIMIIIVITTQVGTMGGAFHIALCVKPFRNSEIKNFQK